MKKFCQSAAAALFTAVLSLCLTFSAACEEAAAPSAEAGDSMPLIGSWAFSHAPETVILQVSEDGTAVYHNKEYTWNGTEGFLILTDAAGDTVSLRYMITDDQKIIYPQTAYHRGKEVEGQGGLIGIWEGVNDGSSFVFTPAGYFLEDNSFSGNFMINEEDGTFLLHYGDVFADTLCYYSIDDADILTVEYPWPITKMSREDGSH